MTRAKALLGSGNLLATEIADALTTSGMPFRDAYKLVGTMVAKAQELGKEVQELTPQELSAAKIDLPASIDLTKINYDSSVERRQNLGGTAKFRILEYRSPESLRLFANYREQKQETSESFGGFLL
jgi:argininosuccinate lyase